MKLHLSLPTGINLITAYGDGFVEINRERRTTSLILLPDSLADWPVARFDDLAAGALAGLLDLRPSLVLLGTGRRHRFPHPSLYQELIAAGIGLEHMDTGAACRTYNILASEGRAVAAALIVE
jgi:uncharacterized protein